MISPTLIALVAHMATVQAHRVILMGITTATIGFVWKEDFPAVLATLMMGNAAAIRLCRELYNAVICQDSSLTQTTSGEFYLI